MCRGYLLLLPSSWTFFAGVKFLRSGAERPSKQGFFLPLLFNTMGRISDEQPPSPAELGRPAAEPSGLGGGDGEGGAGGRAATKEKRRRLTLGNQPCATAELAESSGRQKPSLLLLLLTAAGPTLSSNAGYRGCSGPARCLHFGPILNRALDYGISWPLARLGANGIHLNPAAWSTERRFV